MYYIQPLMLEPLSVSVGMYLIGNMPLTINKNYKIINKNPILFKKKICKMIKNNKDIIFDIIIDETNDYMYDFLNSIKIININPSIFLILYILVLFITIII
jgi:hypothetical protein